MSYIVTETITITTYTSRRQLSRGGLALMAAVYLAAAVMFGGLGIQQLVTIQLSQAGGAIVLYSLLIPLTAALHAAYLLAHARLISLSGWQAGVWHLACGLLLVVGSGLLMLSQQTHWGWLVTSGFLLVDAIVVALLAIHRMTG